MHFFSQRKNYCFTVLKYRMPKRNKEKIITLFAQRKNSRKLNIIRTIIILFMIRKKDYWKRIFVFFLTLRLLLMTIKTKST